MPNALAFFATADPRAFFFLWRFNAVSDVFNPSGWLPSRWQRSGEICEQANLDSPAISHYFARDVQGNAVLFDTRNGLLIACSRLA